MKTTLKKRKWLVNRFKNMEIYRIEDKFGKGYKNQLDSDIKDWTNEGFYNRFFHNESEYFAKRPMPKDDQINTTLIRKYHLFGFKNIEQLNNWFLPADLVMGSLLGGKICVYDINPKYIIFGEKQLIFDERKSKLINKLPMNHFLNGDLKSSLYDFREVAQENVDYDIPIIKELEFLYKNKLHHEN